MSSRGSPSVANLDEDDDLEIVWGNRTGWIFALNKDGSYVDGFPLKTDSPMDGGVLVTDLDGDGLNEVVISGFERGIYVFRSKGRVVANAGWPMFRHDPRRTGYVGTPMREAVEPRLALGLLQGAQLPEFLSITVVATKELASPAAVTLDGTPLDGFGRGCGATLLSRERDAHGGHASGGGDRDRRRAAEPRGRSDRWMCWGRPSRWVGWRRGRPRSRCGRAASAGGPTSCSCSG